MPPPSPPISFPPPRSAPRLRPWRRLWRQTWPWLVWVLLAVGCLVHYRRGVGGVGEIQGVREWAPVAVASLEYGRLAEVLVAPGQQVEAGQIVARVETGGLDLAMAAARATASAEEASELRRRSEGIYRLESSRRDLILRQAEDQAEKGIYVAEAARLEELYGRRLITSESLAAVRARAAALEESCRLYPVLLTEVENEMAALRAAGSVTAQATSAAATLAVLEWQKDQAELKAPLPGIVSQVFHRVGEVVGPNTPILQILPTAPVRFIAFWPEGADFTCAVGEAVEFLVLATGETGLGRVEAISPDVVAVPDRASPLPDRMVRGRRVYVTPQSDADLPPGATVTIRPLNGGGWF